MFQNKKRIYTFINSYSIVVPYFNPVTRYTGFTVAVCPSVYPYVDESFSDEMSHSVVATVSTVSHLVTNTTGIILCKLLKPTKMTSSLRLDFYLIDDCSHACDKTLQLQ